MQAQDLQKEETILNLLANWSIGPSQLVRSFIDYNSTMSRCPDQVHIFVACIYVSSIKTDAILW